MSFCGFHLDYSPFTDSFRGVIARVGGHGRGSPRRETLVVSLTVAAALLTSSGNVAFAQEGDPVPEAVHHDIVSEHDAAGSHNDLMQHDAGGNRRCLLHLERWRT